MGSRLGRHHQQTSRQGRRLSFEASELDVARKQEKEFVFSDSDTDPDSEPETEGETDCE
jgi:hypothetical protein